MTDFVLEQEKEPILRNTSSEIIKIHKYAHFLKQPLTLGMFVPCKLVNGVWVVLEEPVFTTDIAITELPKVKEYQESKDSVLFEGLFIEKFLYKQTKQTVYEINNMRVGIYLEFYNGETEFNFQLSHDYYSIEDLVKYNLELTPTAEKQIGI